MSGFCNPLGAYVEEVGLVVHGVVGRLVRFMCKPKAEPTKAELSAKGIGI